MSDTPSPEPIPTMVEQPGAAPSETLMPSNSSVGPEPSIPGGPWLSILRDRYRVHDRLLAVVVGITVGASCLLISTTHGTKAGHRPWPQDSVLRVVVELLNFNYEYPTPPGGHGVKTLVQNLGAAAALLAAAGIWYVRTRKDELDESIPASPSMLRWGESSFVHVTAGGGAQLALLAVGVWAIASAGWSSWPDASLGGALRNLILLIWAVAIGRTFTRAGARAAVLAVIVALTATSIIALWYYHVRNPELRLEFPIGNPIFFAACMLPGLILPLGLLAGLFEDSQRPLPSTSAARESAESGGSGYRRAIAWVVLCLALTTVLWAFRLADSRGPWIAFLAGAGFAAVIAVLRRVRAERRRPVALVIVGLALLAVVFVGWPWLRAQATVAEGGRGSTLRLRGYTWKYAWQLFLASPLNGHGQGGYQLHSQEMSREDAERDPVCFPTDMIGHAHNEWLEILADLGAIGLVLMAMGLGLTIWLAVRAHERMDDPKDRWCLLGLLACLVAIILEECADVALRRPGLPVIFYTVIGLIWAMARDMGPGGLPVVRPLGKGVRIMGVAGAAVGSLAIAVIGARDWQGGLAAHRAEELADQQKWDAALIEASRAASHRLTLEDRIYADMLTTNVAHGAAAHRMGQIRDTLSRHEEDQAKLAEQLGGSSEDPKLRSARILGVVQEDFVEFDRFSGICIASGSALWENIPSVPSMAGLVSDAWYMRGEAEFTKEQLELPFEEGAQLENALKWLALEYQRDRLDAAVAMKYLYLRMRLQTPGPQVMAELIDLLRIPMRSGPEPWGIQTEIQSGLLVLKQHPDHFGGQMQRLLIDVSAAFSQADPYQWPDWYAPETLRLGALAKAVNGEFEVAVAMADRAVKLYELPLLRRNFPTVLSHGRLDLARYRLWATPDAPQAAVEVCLQAIQDWPPVGQREEQLQPLYRELSIYLLAAGNEKDAAEAIRRAAGKLSDEQVQVSLGLGLWEACGRFISLPADRWPSRFDAWVRRSLELAPDWPAGRVIAATVAFEQGRGTDAVAHLKHMESLLQEPGQMGPTLQGLMNRFPANPQLRAFAGERFPELLLPPETQPGESATRPDGPTTSSPGLP